MTDEDLWEVEMVRHGVPPVTPIPLGAVVTASGTGAEMNGGAVITNEAVKIKGGMFAAAPRFAILDPMYTMTLPASQVISGAFDTLSHAMETYFGRSPTSAARTKTTSRTRSRRPSCATRSPTCTPC